MGKLEELGFNQVGQVVTCEKCGQGWATGFTPKLKTFKRHRSIYCKVTGSKHRPTEPVKITISEARLNDMCFMALKRYWFQPVMGTGPRQCDIRVCMDMAAPERLTVASAVLIPDEEAPISHTRMYEVSLDTVLGVCLDYLNDHWRAEFSVKDRNTIKKDWQRVSEVLMKVDESRCAVEEDV